MADMTSLLVNAAGAAPAMLDLLAIVAQTTGVIIIGQSIYRAMAVSAGKAHHTHVGLFTNKFFGVVLFSLPGFMSGLAGDMGISGAGGFNSLLSHMPGGGAELSQKSMDAINAALTLLRVFGVFAVFKGILMWKRAADGQGNNEEVMRGTVHVVGGVMLANAGAVLASVAAWLLA